MYLRNRILNTNVLCWLEKWHPAYHCHFKMSVWHHATNPLIKYAKHNFYQFSDNLLGIWFLWEYVSGSDWQIMAWIWRGSRSKDCSALAADSIANPWRIYSKTGTQPQAESRNINPLRANFIRRNKNIYLHFMSFFHTDTTQVVNILPQAGQEVTYST